MADRAQDVQTPPWTLGWRLQRALSWADMTAEQMADQLGIHRTTVSRWCHDRGRPKALYLREWADLCRVPRDWLLHGEKWAAGDSNPEPEGLRPGPGRPRREPADNTPREGLTRAELAAFMKHVNLSPAQLATRARKVAA